MSDYFATKFQKCRTRATLGRDGPGEIRAENQGCFHNGCKSKCRAGAEQTAECEIASELGEEIKSWFETFSRILVDVSEIVAVLKIRRRETCQICNWSKEESSIIGLRKGLHLTKLAMS